MPQINKMMGIGSPGLVAGFPALSDEWRWRYLHYNNVAQTPAPRGSTLRVSRHANGYFHFGVTIDQVEEEADGLILTTTKDGVWKPISSFSVRALIPIRTANP